MATLPKNTLRETSLTKGRGVEDKVNPRLANDRPNGDRTSRSEQGTDGRNQATLPSSPASSVRGAPPYSKPKENAPKDFTKEVVAQQCAVFPDFLKRKDTTGPVGENDQWQHKKSGAKGK